MCAGEKVRKKDRRKNGREREEGKERKDRREHTDKERNPDAAHVQNNNEQLKLKKLF